MNHFIKDWVVPFYHVKLDDWDRKKSHLLKIYKTRAEKNMIEDEQVSDFDQNNHYEGLILKTLYKDLIDGVEALGYEGLPTLDNSWFQIYNKDHTHSPHNHGIGILSLVVFIEFSEGHKPTTFLSPFLNFKNGHIMEYSPKDVGEGSMIIFPSALVHYAPVNKTDTKRMILSSNLSVVEDK